MASEQDKAMAKELRETLLAWGRDDAEWDARLIAAIAAARAEGAAEARAECKRLTQDRSRFAADVPPVEHYTPDEWREKAIVLGMELANAMDMAERACDEAAALRAEVGRLREACKVAADWIERLHGYSQWVGTEIRPASSIAYQLREALAALTRPPGELTLAEQNAVRAGVAGAMAEGAKEGSDE